MTNSAENGRRSTSAAEGAVNSAGAISDGADPDDVGRLVLDAIRNDRFWILTAPELVTSEHQVAAVAEDHSLSRLRLS